MRSLYEGTEAGVVSPPVLPAPERVEFEGTAEGNDEQEAADQAADQGGRDHLPGHRRQAVPLVAPVQAVLLAVTPPRLEDAQVGPAVEVPRLAVVAVLLVGAIGAPLLVVAALRGRVAHSGAALAGELPARAGRAGLLVAARRAVPVAVAALALGVAALIAATGTLAGETVTFDLGERRERPVTVWTPRRRLVPCLHQQSSYSLFQPLIRKLLIP